MGPDAAGESEQVLEFRIGESDFCVDIAHVAEIVDGGELTPVPNTPPAVNGVMDLRGRTTTIVDPATVLELRGPEADRLATDGGSQRQRIVVLDRSTTGTDGATGWLVSEVDRVTEITGDRDDVNGISDSDLVEGVIKRDDSFTVWLDPTEFAV